VTRATKPECALPAPAEFAPLKLDCRFNAAEAAQIAGGFQPEAMEDKWLIYSEGGWVYFHRSWTGALIYWLRLEANSDGATIAESYANRDAAQYTWTDDEYDQKLLSFLIDTLLLKRDAVFPVPPKLRHDPDGLLQHHVAGAGGKQRSWLARLFGKR
jgi:hypothetical protein